MTPTERTKKVIARDDLYAKALRWCKTNQYGAKKCVQQREFSGLGSRSLQRRLNDEAGKLHHSRVLTDDEELTLAKWLDFANKVNNGKTREEIVDKVIPMLKRRKTLRKASKQR